jgi:hypothetical protein
VAAGSAGGERATLGSGTLGATDVVGAAVASAGFASGGVDAVVTGSILKSLIVGGGTLAGSGRGIAASIASSAALERGWSPCAKAVVADTVRKLAAIAIKTRSNRPRLFERSRIVTPLG